MRKQMIESAALEVAAQVRAVEESIESALIELAELVHDRRCSPLCAAVDNDFVSAGTPPQCRTVNGCVLPRPHPAAGLPHARRVGDFHHVCLHRRY